MNKNAIAAAAKRHAFLLLFSAAALSLPAAAHAQQADPVLDSEAAENAEVEGGTQVDDTGTGSINAAATGDSEGCQSALDRLTGSIEDIRARQDERRADVVAAASSEPLIVAMADGKLVYLGGEEELSEPFESWFVSEEQLKREVALSEEAQGLLEAEKSADCVALLSGDAEESSAEAAARQ